MARKYNTGNVQYGSTFDIGATRPIDSRLIVDKISDLTNPETWPLETAPAYTGMPVIVLEDLSLYILKDEKHKDEIEYWKKAGGSGGIGEDDLPTTEELGFETTSFKELILTLLDYIKNSISEIEGDDDISISVDDEYEGIGKKLKISINGINGNSL